MSDYTEQEIDRLLEELSAIYHRGKLTAAEQVTVKGYWARIERLETAVVASKVREARVAELLLSRREKEGKHG